MTFGGGRPGYAAQAQGWRLLAGMWLVLGRCGRELALISQPHAASGYHHIPAHGSTAQPASRQGKRFRVVEVILLFYEIWQKINAVKCKM